VFSRGDAQNRGIRIAKIIKGGMGGDASGKFPGFPGQPEMNEGYELPDQVQPRVFVRAVSFQQVSCFRENLGHGDEPLEVAKDGRDVL
jgi:hypothetical protein